MDMNLRSSCWLITILCFAWSPTLRADTSFWDGTDIADSGAGGLIDYLMQKQVHDALLVALPVDLQADGLPVPTGGVCGEDPISTPGTNQAGRFLNRMYTGVLQGPRGLRIPCMGGKCQYGYTLLNAFTPPEGHGSTVLIDMDGNVVHSWGAGAGFRGAAKMLKGGHIISSEGGDLVQRDWCGNEVKRFAGLRNHHDHQRAPSSVGYFAPGQAADTNKGKSLSLGYFDPDISLTSHITDVKRFYPGRDPRPIRDDVIREIDWDGNVLFEWFAWEHFEQFSFDEAAEYAMDLGLNSGGCSNRVDSVEDWSHGNSVAWLGRNKWYNPKRCGEWSHQHHEKGSGKCDLRFHPDNIIADFRSLNTTIIIARHDHPDWPAEGTWLQGDIVWQLGPDYSTAGDNGKVGQIIGQHMAYMIPDNLPGAGNILILDNGGGAGYGALIEGLEDPDTGEKLGFWPNKYRGFSRVLEINPVTKQLVWEYKQPEPTTGSALGNDHLFYSNVMAGAQRLRNGNTLITEADTGRIVEVTRDGEVVWEYAPGWLENVTGFAGSVYRAYRVPENWLPKHMKHMTCPTTPTVPTTP